MFTIAMLAKWHCHKINFMVSGTVNFNSALPVRKMPIARYN